jgi:cysteinyl-tRNA synthetase
MHNGFVRVDDEKMSKSLGNFFTIREVLKVFDAEVVRLFILRAHYRSPLNYSDTHIERRQARADAAVHGAQGRAQPGAVDVDWSLPHAQRFKAAMDDDFGTPEAVAVLFEMANEANRGNPALAVQLRALGGVLGLLQRPVSEVRRGGLLGRAQSTQAGLADDAIDALIAQRALAKKSRDFASADRIRAELLAQGVVLEDGASGTTWRRG